MLALHCNLYYLYIMQNETTTSKTLEAVRLYSLGYAAQEIADMLLMTLEELFQETSKYLTF